MMFFVYGQRHVERGYPKKPMTVKIPGKSGSFAYRVAFTDQLEEDERHEYGLEYVGCYSPDALRQIRAEKTAEKKPRVPIFAPPAIV